MTVTDITANGGGGGMELTDRRQTNGEGIDCRSDDDEATRGNVGNDSDENDEGEEGPLSPAVDGDDGKDEKGGRTRKKQFAVSTRWERDREEAAQRADSLGSRCPALCRPCLDCTGNPSEDFHNLFCCCATRRIGGMFSLLEKRDGTPLVIAGPCWPFCAFVTLPLILSVSALVIYFILAQSRVPKWLALVYLPLAAVTLISLFFVSCRDPGLIERVADEDACDVEEGWFWNEQVGSFRPAGAMYCRECKVLIQDYDHLCPWTGTGIGKGNMNAFRAFVVSVNVLCYLSIALVAFVLLRGLPTG